MMAQAQNKTIATDASVEAFLNTIEDERKRKDSFALLELMSDVTGFEPVMWGSSIVGFGSYHYKGASGREGDWMMIGFSPRKANISLYLTSDHQQHADLFRKLGKHSTGVGCVYVKRLDDVDMGVLRQLVVESFAAVKARAE
jgi:hypothetical protein